MGRLTALVLGSAAGGGFPQWNCRCPTCRLAWAGDARVRPRTQASLADAGHARMLYIPGAAAVTEAMMARMSGADVVFFDGTLFRDDEMITTGTGAKTGRRMGHMPIDGEAGSLAALEGLAGRRIYVHINNTNPILVEGSPERVLVERSGWEVAEDGMEIAL